MKKVILLLTVITFPNIIVLAQKDDNIKNGEDAYQAKNYTKAEAYLSNYIHSFQNDVPGYLKQMHEYNNANTYQRATTYANFKINHQWAQALVDRAKTYIKLSYPDNVEKDLDMAISIDPTCGEAYYMQSRIKKEKGDKLGDCICIGKAMEYNDTLQAAKLAYSNDFCWETGLQYFKKGKEKVELKEYSDAIKNLNIATLISPDSASYFTYSAMAYSGIGNNDSALIDYNRAVKADPKNFTASYNRGLYYEQIQKYKEAFDDFSQAIKVNQNSVEAHLHRAAVAENMQMEHSAIYDYQLVIKIKPNEGIAYFKVAEYWKKIGQSDKACDYFNKAVGLGIEDAQAGVDDCRDAAAKILTK